MAFESALQLNIYSIILLIILLYNLYKKYGINNKVTKLFVSILFVTIAMLVFDGLGRFDGLSKPHYIYFNKIGNTVSFILNPVLASLWMIFILEIVGISKKKKMILEIVMISVFLIFALLSFLSIFATNNNFFFYINEDNIYIRGKLFFLTIAYTVILVIGALLIVLFNKAKVDRRLFVSLFFFPIPPLIGVALQTIYYGSSLILNGVAISALFVHLHLQAIQMNTDYLTKIYNRRKLIFKLTDETKKARPGKTFSGILIDLVEFKHINDSYGHLFGDEVLVRTAEILKKVIGPFNHLYRYGGDEFFIVISPAQEAETKKYIQKMREEIKDYKIPTRENFKLELTFGYLLYDPIDKLTVDEFLEEIDQLMYNNKIYNIIKE